MELPEPLAFLPREFGLCHFGVGSPESRRIVSSGSGRAFSTLYEEWATETTDAATTAVSVHDAVALGEILLE